MKVMIKKGISSDYAKPLKALYDERRLLMETEVYKSKPLMLRKDHVYYSNWDMSLRIASIHEGVDAYDGGQVKEDSEEIQRDTFKKKVT